MKDISIYIHIPFCESKCYYCDFTSFAGIKNKVSDYVEALLKEVKLYSEDLKGHRVKTIFLGGGTPSSIDSTYIEQIMSTLKEELDLSEVEEITLESNPGTLDAEKIRTYSENGINRISMGGQSFNDDILRSIGRIHTKEDIYNSINIIRDNGIDNINLDLMFGLPNQTMDDVLESLEEAIKLDLNHISYYSLIIEENTKMYNLFKDREELFPSEELDREMYHRTKSILENNGFNHYEISNYAKRGYESLHNLAYWNLKEYIGFGLGSHSNFNKQRFSNTYVLDDYIDSLKNKKRPIIETENINRATEIFEYAIMGIRKIEGINKCDFEKRFNNNIEDIYIDVLDKHEKNGLIVNGRDFIYLTKKGLDLSNLVELDFLI